MKHSDRLAWAAAAALALVAAPLATVSPVRADELSAEEIVRKADRTHRAKDETGTVEMVLVSEDQRKMRRDLKLMFKAGEKDDDKHLLRFLSPPDVSGTALLTIEATGRSDDQWVFLPALKKSKKIASADRTNRFALTDFTYEDLRTEDMARNDYTRAGEAKVEGRDTYVIEARPKADASSGYGKRLLYVDKERFLTLQIDFYDKKDKHQKTLRNQEYEQVSGLWRPSRTIMEDHQRGTKTLWRVTERKINPGLDDSAFTVTSLERGL